MLPRTRPSSRQLLPRLAGFLIAVTVAVFNIYGLRDVPEAAFLDTWRLPMTHGMDPGRMTPAERADEVGMLLSLAMMRLWLKRRALTGRERWVSREFSQVGQDCLELPRHASPDGPVH